MDYLSTLLHLSLIHILMAMLPGPNTVLVGYCSISQSRRAGFVAAAGVATASLIWVSLSLAGVGILLVNAGGLFRLLRFLGAAYLIYVGVRLLRSSGKGLELPQTTVYRSPFMAGILTTLSNPKSAVFWTSIFSIVIPASAPLWFWITVAALTTMQSLCWYAAVALVFSSPVSRRHYANVGTALNRISGGFMVFFGLKIMNDLRN
jgi:threonine efflux protein